MAKRSEETSPVGAPGASSSRWAVSGALDGFCLSPHGHGDGRGGDAAEKTRDVAMSLSTHVSPSSRESSSICRIRRGAGGRGEERRGSLARDDGGS
jgi:hypothetical protein